MYRIENEYLRVDISAKGAELQSVFHKEYGIEYMWSGDPAFWGKKSPVLFPIVGSLKKDTYFFKDKAYQLGRHGFAREMEFKVGDEQLTSISFLIESDEHTRQHYPFEFEFTVTYKLEGNRLTVTYTAGNTGTGTLYFSVGGHPAFRIPLAEGTTYTDYHLIFNKKENLQRWPISKDGLIEKVPEPLESENGLLPLTKELFLKDALVFKHPASSQVSIRSDQTKHGLDFQTAGFPYLGIWAARQADFVCIEPWCGIADSVDSDQQLVHKEGINALQAGEIFEQSWSVDFY